MQLHDILSLFLNTIKDNKHVTVKGCFGSGKTFDLAVACHWFLNTNVDCKIATTAPGQRQVRDLLWAEIKHLQENSRVILPGVMLTERLIKGGKWYAAGFTGQKYNESSFQGYHAPRVLYGIDEACGVEPRVFGARRKLLMNDSDRFIAIGNALDRNTEFGRSFIDPLFVKLTITAFDCPNVKAGRTIIPGMVTSEWLKEMAPLEGTGLWKTYVMADFPEDTENALFPLAWIEAAFLRHEQGLGVNNSEKVVGCDVATSGSDLTVYAKWIGNYCESLSTVHGNDTQEVANQLELEIKRGYRAAVDSIGVGAGVADTLSHRGYDVARSIGSESSERKDSTGSFGFVNKRSELFWTLHELLDPKHPTPISLPRDEKLREELAVHTFEPVTGGKIRVLQKEKVKDLLGRSPDRADAIAISLAARGAEAYSAFETKGIITTNEETRNRWY